MLFPTIMRPWLASPEAAAWLVDDAESAQMAVEDEQHYACMAWLLTAVSRHIVWAWLPDMKASGSVDSPLLSS